MDKLTPEQFCYWLQGFVELCPNQHPTISQWGAVKDHLNLVFKKVTPYYSHQLRDNQMALNPIVNKMSAVC